MTSYRNMLVFTDLDGTLLDQNYSWEPAAKVIENLKTAGVPLIFCSSKTRAEIEHYREAMGIKDPFISENGACTFIPDGYFDFEFPFTKESGGYKLIEAGKPYGEVLDKINEIKGVPGMGGITCFSDMTDEQLSTDARLPLKLARLAKLSIVVPTDDTPRIQEVHIMIAHIICELIEDACLAR